jgi:DNA invertase Pin-like site-specific DNA recombinase
LLFAAFLCGTVVKPRGIEFVSFSEQLDTSTPAGKMVFTVLGAVAELERGLIVERVKAGLHNARAKGRRLGRPKKILDTKRIATLRAEGVGWKRIAAEMGLESGRSIGPAGALPLLDGSDAKHLKSNRGKVFRALC